MPRYTLAISERLITMHTAACERRRSDARQVLLDVECENVWTLKQRADMDYAARAVLWHGCLFDELSRETRGETRGETRDDTKGGANG